MLRKVLQSGSMYGHCYTQISRTVYISSILYVPRNFGKDLPPQSATTADQDSGDISTLTEVESNLFQNTENLHKPVNTKELLKQYRPEPPKQKVVPPKINSSFNKPKKVAPKKETSPIIKDVELGLEYVKLGLNDPLLPRLLLTAKSRKQREKKRQLVVEGRRLILEAINCKYKMQTLLFSQKDQLATVKDNIKHLKNLQIIKVPQQNLKAWSTLTTCPGLLAIFDRPENTDMIVPKSTPLPITVVCDNIREPSNLGSIIRSCAAIPCAQVVVLKGCCDPWDTKALRGGCGGQFRVQIKDNFLWEDLEKLLPDNFSIFIAESNLNKVDGSDPTGYSIIPYTDVDVNGEHNVLVIGGETYGVSEDAYRFLASHRIGSCIHIPLAKGVDSLNTASALTLILFEMRKLILEKQFAVGLQQESVT